MALDLSLPGKASETASRSEDPVLFHLPTGPWRQGQMPTVEAAGRMVQTAWRIEGTDASTAALARDLGAQLAAQGYETLFACATADCGGFDFRYNAGILPAPEMYVDLGDFHYLAAQSDAGEAPEHLSLVISRSAGAAYVQLTRIGGEEGAATTRALPEATATKAQALSLDPHAPADIAGRLSEGLPVVLEDLAFAPGSTQLTEGEFASLAAVRDWLAANPKAQLVLVGHTDDIGSLAANIRVSKLRAEAIRQKLLFEGAIAPDRISAEGAGYLSPRQSNRSETGRHANRRVEAVPLLPSP